MRNISDNAMKGKSAKFQDRRHMFLYETTCFWSQNLWLVLSLKQLLQPDKSVSSEEHITVGLNYLCNNTLMKRKSFTKTVREDEVEKCRAGVKSSPTATPATLL